MQPAPARMQFGPFTVDPSTRLLTGNGVSVHLAPKSCEVLLVLLRHSGEVVSKETLLRSVWPDVAVEEGNLTQHISLLRKTLGAAPSGGPYIETIPKSGYRFLVPVHTLPDLPPSGLRRRAALALALVPVVAFVSYWIGRLSHPLPEVAVVSPFENLTGDPANQILCESLRSAIIAELANFPRYRLHAQSSHPELLITGRIFSAGGQLQFLVKASHNPAAPPLWYFEHRFPPQSAASAALRARVSLHQFLHHRDKDPFSTRN